MEEEKQEHIFTDAEGNRITDVDQYRIKSIVVDPGQEPIRIDKYLVSRIQNITRTKFRKAADVGNVLVNASAVKANYKVAPNDEIIVLLPVPHGQGNLIAQDIPLDIVYEDDDILLVNKQSGLVVHPGVGNYTGTLVNALMFHCKTLGKGKNLLQPGIVHRLDKETTGVMICAKNDEALSYLSKQFFEKTNHRKYVSLVWGDLENDEGTIVKNIARDPRDRKRMAAFDPEEEIGKHSVTHYKVIERFGYVTLVECVLETGRTHQIRVHMASMGHTVFNDYRYGGNQIVKGTVFSKYKQFVENCFSLCPRQALHAKELGIEHPTTKEWMSFEVDIPEDMQSVIEKWRRYTSNRL